MQFPVTNNCQFVKSGRFAFKFTQIISLVIKSRQEYHFKIDDEAISLFSNVSLSNSCFKVMMICSDHLRIA